MKRTETVADIFWGGKKLERTGVAGSKVSFCEIIVRTPLTILGLTISIFPVSLPLLYLVALLFV